MFFLLILLGVALVVYYLKFKYFSLHGPVPGLSPHFLFGNLIQSGILFHGASSSQVYSKFKARYGDTYQFWLGPMRSIVVSGLDDVQHIFTHRNIYDQSDFIVEQIGAIFPDGFICNKGNSFLSY